MKYKRFVYTPVLLIITTLQFSSGSQDSNHIRGIFDKYTHASKLERIVAMWNRSSEATHRKVFPPKEAEEEDTLKEEPAPAPVPVPLPVPAPVPNSITPSEVSSFPSEVSRCIEQNQFQITENYSQGKSIILNCFKTSLMLTVLGRYLGDSSKSSIKLFNGLLEFKKIPESECSDENCDQNRNFGSRHNKKDEYIRMYKKAMQKLINQRNKFNTYRNLTEEERKLQLKRIDANSQAFLSEVIRNMGNEEVEKMEEEKLKKEMLDPRLLSMLDALSRNYMLKLKFYPGVSARMMRSNNGGFTFDLEIPEADEGGDEGEYSSDESLTREIKDVSEDEEYIDENESTSRSRRGSRGKGGYKKKRKELKKKAKKLKKFLPYLLLPMIIQVSLLPFVFKKLFFLAMKALLAGKVALILVAFNLLKNSCEHRDDFQKIRVEHYGYRRGEEYGAWVNGRSLTDLPSLLSEEPYRAYRPTSE